MPSSGGIILAGGLSSRMGQPKAWLALGGRTMLETVVAAVDEGLRLAGPASPPPLVVVAAAGQRLPPLPAGVMVTHDEVAEQGPLQGMAAGLAALDGRAEVAYVSSCDAPLLRPAFVARMVALLGGAAIAVPRVDERYHPLAGVYRLEVLTVIRELLAASRRRPFFLFERVATRVVTADDLRTADPDLVSLRNVNTPEEYRELLATLAGAAPHTGENGAETGARVAVHQASHHAVVASSQQPAPVACVDVIFELYGVARLRAGRDEVPVQGGTLGDVLAALETVCPELSGTLLQQGRLTEHARLSVNGREFVSDPARPLKAGDRLILISAAAGG